MIEDIQKQVVDRFARFGYEAQTDDKGFTVEGKHVTLDWESTADVQLKMNEIHGEYADNIMAEVIADNIVIDYLHGRRN